MEYPQNSCNPLSLTYFQSYAMKWPHIERSCLAFTVIAYISKLCASNQNVTEQ